HLYVTRYTEGFSHFVTSMTAPVASGWSVRRVGLAPTGKRRLLTAHANSGHSATAWRAGQIDAKLALGLTAQACLPSPQSPKSISALPSRVLCYAHSSGGRAMSETRKIAAILVADV